MRLKKTVPGFLRYVLVFLFLGIVLVTCFFWEIAAYLLILPVAVFIIVILFAKTRILPSKENLREWIRIKKKKGLKVLLIEGELLRAGLVKRELEEVGQDLERLVHVISV